jgi:predicted phosphatase
MKSKTSSVIKPKSKWNSDKYYDRTPNVRSFEEVQQLLEQAKASGDKFQTKIWSDCLKALKARKENK